MKTKQWMLCVWFLIWTAMKGLAFNDSPAFKTTCDSLKNVLNQLQPGDSARLIVLGNLAQFHQQQGDLFIFYEDQLLKEAIAQGNLRYQSKAIYGHLAYYYNHLDLQQVEIWIKRLEEFATTNQYYDDYFKAKWMLITLYVNEGQIERSIMEAEELDKMARQQNDSMGMCGAALCLANSYYSSMRYDESREQTNRAANLVAKSFSLVNQLNSLTEIVASYERLRMNDEYQNTLVRLREVKNAIIKANPLLKDAIGSLSLFIESGEAIYWLRQNNTKEAHKHLKLADKCLATTPYPQYLSQYYQAYAVYYLQTGAYRLALDHIDQAIEMAGRYSATDVVGCKMQKAEILERMGKPADALPLYQQALQEKDTLYRSMSLTQMEQIRGLYEIDRLTLEKERQLGRMNSFLLIAGLLILAMLIIFIIHLLRDRRRLLDNKNEVQRLTAVAEEANRLKGVFLANMSYGIRIPLNNVVGFSQLLATDENLSEAERLEYSSIVQTNSNELIQLVNDVLDLSRLEAGMMKFLISEMAAADLCTDISTWVLMQSGGSITVQTNIEVGDAIVHGDLVQLTKAIQRMLLYPEPCDKERQIDLTMKLDPQQSIICGTVTNSPLSDPAYTSQKTAVYNKINQLLFEHFGGTYNKVSENPSDKVPSICFTYPVTL